MKKLEYILSKYHKYFLAIALILSSLAISIRFSKGEVNLILYRYPVLITVLITFSIFLVALYFHFNSKKMISLSSQIKELSDHQSKGIELLISELTERQKEVYDLIKAGKSNKEIMAELYIEQSTLKSHINQIYKKLNINSRAELRTG